MKKSVKLIASVVVVGGGLWLGGAWYTGTRLEAISPEQVARINAELGKTAQGAEVKISQLSFDRGLFNSQARYALTITDEDDRYTLELDTRYEHGPLPLSALSRGQFAPTMTIVHSDLARTDDVQEWFKATQNATTPWWYEAVVSYGGDATFQSGFAAVKIDQDGEQLDFSGASLQGEYTRATQRLHGTFSAPELTLSATAAEPFQFSLSGTQIDVDVKKNAFDVWTGDVESRFNRLTATNPSLGKLSIEKLVYGGSSSEDERFIKGSAYLRGEALSVNDFAFGDLSLTFLMDRLDGPTLKHMHDDVGALAASSADGSVDPHELIKVLRKHGSTLLNAKPKFSIAPLSWKTAQGESTLNLHTEFGDPGNLSLPAVVIVMQMLKSVTLDVTLNKSMVIDLAASLMQLSQGVDADEADEVAHEEYEMLADQLVKAGFATKNSDTLASKVQYGNGKITVNGRDVSMRELMGLMMAF